MRDLTLDEFRIAWSSYWGRREIGFVVEGSPRIYDVPNAVVVMPEAERSNVSVFEYSLRPIDSVED